MKLGAYCMYCMIKRQMENVEKCQDEVKKAEYMKNVLKIITDSEDLAAPVITARINRLHLDFFKTSYSFDELKEKYNNLMLQKEQAIYHKITASADRLLEAIKYARVGNYIDFGAMGSVDNNKLETLLETAHKEEINETEYEAFLKDISMAKELVYLTDNCGEIVLDKLLIKIIKEQYPKLNITVIVRGKPILNDATLEDAKLVKLDELVPVMGNGLDVPGTYLEKIEESARAKIEKADLIISKGQGNFETLNGCGLNIYYIFLCKCDWFLRRFQLEKFKGVFLNEKNLVDTMKQYN
ncbi:damage-control phosphatase ARMT1 family protein [Anaerocolumna sp. MB42-C2]|uniref:damage-control phosphatase ARMT1 family protein n=1 Tax=Anaerocolumna sp. MB42-C2 TaxID=3070997 RepID=UPI0027E1ACB6|nr:ARMT1-like domain-containing protein [Anaerocolumna sp. MB42-C2]WMJ85379.1 ARMT1-like domain-containing protein [Anaerocolumna sp. MB42-C2]